MSLINSQFLLFLCFAYDTPGELSPGFGRQTSGHHALVTTSDSVGRFPMRFPECIINHYYKRLLTDTRLTTIHDRIRNHLATHIASAHQKVTSRPPDGRCSVSLAQETTRNWFHFTQHISQLLQRVSLHMRSQHETQFLDSVTVNFTNHQAFPEYKLATQKLASSHVYRLQFYNDHCLNMPLQLPYSIVYQYCIFDPRFDPGVLSPNLIANARAYFLTPIACPDPSMAN